MSRLFFVILLSFACFAAFGNKSYANEFTAVAAGCVPDPANIQKNDYLITGGTVKHQTGNFRDIHLRCPISIVITKPTHIYLVASDNDTGVGTFVTFVSAQLVAKSNYDDSINYFCSVNTDQARQDGSVHLIDVPCSVPVTWDQTRNAWFLHITIHRRSSSSSSIAVFYGAGVY
jgi:hypothetical protein